jgi:hypothetical protein
MCDKIFLGGYSRPPVDRRACDLLLQRPRRETRIEIVTGSQSDRITNDVRMAGLGNVQTFKGWYL